ncbi:MAG: universal stress protein [Acidimicrobiales bacterium]|nr:universal stress protein [Acidimicrobiales bacterium]
MNGRIVVGVDGSAGSRAALEFAIKEASLRGARVDAVISWHIPVMAMEAGVASNFDPEGWARSTLEDELAAVPAGDVHVEGRVARGHPSVALLEAASGADLLVVGTRGRGGFAGLLLGSVSQHCVANAPCPVVVVPQAEQ